MEDKLLEKEIKLTNKQQVIRRCSLSFEELFTLKYLSGVRLDSSALLLWNNFEVYAKIKRDFVMNVWNGKHPSSENYQQHICKAGSLVRIWMVSSQGDIGITDNLVNPNGYRCRGVCVEELYDWEFMIPPRRDTKLKEKLVNLKGYFLEEFV